MKIALASFAVVLLSGCALPNLRPNLNDLEEETGPITGGRWAERGLLNEGEAREEGGRELASASENARSRGRSWISNADSEANQRDVMRAGIDENGEPTVVSSGDVANFDPLVRRVYKNGSRATRSDFVDEASNEGSLWGSNGQTNYYFSKNKVRTVGDIVTLNVENDLVRDIGTEVRRKLNPREKEIELDLAETRMRKGGAGDGKTDKLATGAAAPERAPAAAGAKTDAKEPEPEATGRSATLADIDVAKSLEIKTGDQMMGEIIERYPNGNYKVRGTKRVPYRNGAARLVNLVGVVRGTDITEDDVIPSGKLYEYKVEATR